MSFTGITVLKLFLEQGDLRTVHSTTCLFRKMCLTRVDFTYFSTTTVHRSFYLLNSSVCKHEFRFRIINIYISSRTTNTVHEILIRVKKSQMCAMNKGS